MARWLEGLGIEARLLPPKYVRAYVRRNRTDAADARALMEAARACDMMAARIQSGEQQWPPCYRSFDAETLMGESTLRGVGTVAESAAQRSDSVALVTPAVASVL